MKAVFEVLIAFVFAVAIGSVALTPKATENAATANAKDLIARQALGLKGFPAPLQETAAVDAEQAGPEGAVRTAMIAPIPAARIER